MKKSVMKKWVEALRSGEYFQGYGMLKHNDSYCCLGVLCEISKKAKWKAIQKNSSMYLYSGNGEILPPKVWEWAGLKSGNPGIEEHSHYLSEFNDSRNYSFEDIADLIEQNYKKL